MVAMLGERGVTGNVERERGGVERVVVRAGAGRYVGTCREGRGDVLWSWMLHVGGSVKRYPFSYLSETRRAGVWPGSNR